MHFKTGINEEPDFSGSFYVFVLKTYVQPGLSPAKHGTARFPVQRGYAHSLLLRLDRKMIKGWEKFR
jgi:hypothetical protein